MQQEDAYHTNDKYFEYSLEILNILYWHSVKLEESQNMQVCLRLDLVRAPMPSYQ
jgi:hypothetical protein